MKPAWMQFEDPIEHARRVDYFGHMLHVFFALGFAASLPIATAPKDICLASLIVCSVARLHATRWVYQRLLRDSMFWIALALASVLAASSLWSPAPELGLHLIRTTRFLLFPLACWPIVDHAVSMVRAFLVGVVVLNVLQLLQGLEWFGMHAEMNGRLHGLNHPIQSGTFCCAAMLWHGGACFSSFDPGHSSKLIHPWRARLMSIAFGLIAGAGLVATGSRGPWIAAAVSVPLLFVVSFLRLPRARPAVVALGLVSLIVVAGGAFAGKSFLTLRITQAQADLAEVREGNYDSDVGYRLASYETAIDAFRDQPLIGQGGGGFLSFAGDGRHAELLQGHSYTAHSLYFHVLAEQGLIGIAVMACFLGLVLVRSVRIFSNRLKGDSNDVFAVATPVVTVSWLVAAIFDAYHTGGQTWAFYNLILAVSLSRRTMG